MFGTLKNISIGINIVNNDNYGLRYVNSHILFSAFCRGGHFENGPIEEVPCKIFLLTLQILNLVGVGYTGGKNGHVSRICSGVHI